MEERRKFIRVKDLKSVEVRVKNSSGKMDIVEVKDMSLNGINFYSEVEFEKEQIIQMEISLSDGMASIEIEGKVFWQLASIGNRFATGVRFNHNDDGNKERLSKFIEERAKGVTESREFIRCQLNADVAVSDLNDPKIKFSAKIVDVSHGGMKMSWTDKIKIGAAFKFSFSLPGDQEAIEFKGLIVWIIKDKDGDSFSSGIIYADHDFAGKKKITDYIEKNYKSKK